MEEEALTGEILGAGFAVANELGNGFLEKIYEASLAIELKERRLRVERQVPLQVSYHGILVGTFFADLLVEERVVLEIKATEGLRREHIAQVLNYLRATGLPVGLLLNFGQPRLEFRRLNNKFKST